MAATMTQSPPFMSPNPKAHSKQHQEVDDHLDTLSLRDLPITTTAVDHHSLSPSPSQHQQSNHSRRSSSDPTADFFFEFLVNNDDDLITSAADDVIFHGRLLPFTPPQPQPHPRRSLSLSSRFTRRQLTDSYSESSPPSTIRPSKSLNYRKLHRNHHRSNSKPKSEPLHRSSCNNNNNNEKLTPAKSPWNWLIFGLPKIPAEMELKDRQYRRNLSASKSSNSSSGENNNNRCLSSSSASWRFLSVLSCKSHATVDVHNTTPFRNNFLM